VFYEKNPHRLIIEGEKDILKDIQDELPKNIKIEFKKIEINKNKENDKYLYCLSQEQCKSMGIKQLSTNKAKNKKNFEEWKKRHTRRD
jgi:hypothetical protein